MEEQCSTEQASRFFSYEVLLRNQQTLWRSLIARLSQMSIVFDRFWLDVVDSVASICIRWLSGNDVIIQGRHETSQAIVRPINVCLAPTEPNTD